MGCIIKIYCYYIIIKNIEKYLTVIINYEISQIILHVYIQKMLLACTYLWLYV